MHLRHLKRDIHMQMVIFSERFVSNFAHKIFIKTCSTLYFLNGVEILCVRTFRMLPYLHCSHSTAHIAIGRKKQAAIYQSLFWMSNLVCCVSSWWMMMMVMMTLNHLGRFILNFKCCISFVTSCALDDVLKIPMGWSVCVRLNSWCDIFDWHSINILCSILNTILDYLLGNVRRIAHTPFAEHVLIFNSKQARWMKWSER